MRSNGEEPLGLAALTKSRPRRAALRVLLLLRSSQANDLDIGVDACDILRSADISCAFPVDTSSSPVQPRLSTLLRCLFLAPSRASANHTVPRRSRPAHSHAQSIHVRAIMQATAQVGSSPLRSPYQHPHACQIIRSLRLSFVPALCCCSGETAAAAAAVGSSPIAAAAGDGEERRESAPPLLQPMSSSINDVSPTRQPLRSHAQEQFALTQPLPRSHQRKRSQLLRAQLASLSAHPTAGQQHANLSAVPRHLNTSAQSALPLRTAVAAAGGHINGHRGGSAAAAASDAPNSVCS